MYCTNCGAENESDSKFCRSCGRQVVPEETPTEVAPAWPGGETAVTVAPPPAAPPALPPVASVQPGPSPAPGSRASWLIPAIAAAALVVLVAVVAVILLVSGGNSGSSFTTKAGAEPVGVAVDSVTDKT